jgi:carboxypeptidase T
MKKSILLLALFFAISLKAQNYSRVQIKNGRNLMPQLLELGIDMEHSTHQDADLLLEISDYDVNQLKQANLTFSVLIPNLEAYYSERLHNAANHKIASSGSCRPSQIVTPSNFHLGSMGGSFTLQEMIHQLDSMALLYPSLITVKQPISNIKSVENRDIWYVKISDNAGLDENEPEVLYSALHHAREGGSLSQLIFYMWYLLENYNSNPEIQSLVNNRELFFVPCVNPDGYFFNEQNNPGGGGMWRKNRRLNADSTFGVDLNRNYGYNWGFNNQGSSPNPVSDTYRGTAAFSEPETQAMQAFCNSRQFKTALNAHTFGNFLITPWGFQQSGNTPDSARFKEMGDYLSRENRYYHGSAMQTVNYPVNGNSDDWMYGEQISKGKIMALTPEMGGPNDGFWPQTFRIVDICKSALEQNLRLAKLAGPHVAFVDEQDYFVNASPYIRFALKDIGLQPGTATISLSPLTGISGFAAAKSFSFQAGQTIVDSIAFTLQNNLQPGQVLRYALLVNDGNLAFHDTLEKVLGPAQTLFYSSGSGTPSGFVNGNWGFSTQDPFSLPSSWSDSPLGPYQGGVSNNLTTSVPISLVGKLKPQLQFYFKQAIEKSYDDLRILISTNQGQTYSPLCGNYATPDYTYDGQVALYDGRQISWVKEEIDLSAYAGSSVLLRWQLNSDNFDERDGAYIDEIKVRAIGNTDVGVVQQSLTNGNITVAPNPAQTELNIYTDGNEVATCCIYNLQGVLCMKMKFEQNTERQILVESLSPGLYILRWEDGRESTLIKFIKN